MATDKRLEEIRQRAETLEDRVKAMKAELNKLLDEHPCSYGGFEGGEIVPQPCDRCDAIRDALSRLSRVEELQQQVAATRERTG